MKYTVIIGTLTNLVTGELHKIVAYGYYRLRDPNSDYDYNRYEMEKVRFSGNQPDIFYFIVPYFLQFNLDDIDPRLNNITIVFTDSQKVNRNRSNYAFHTIDNFDTIRYISCRRKEIELTDKVV
jgi:hypothetical protein